MDQDKLQRMAEIDNPTLETDQFPPLAEQSFQHVAPAYRTQLRVQLLPWLAGSAGAWWLAPRVFPGVTEHLWLHGLIAALPALLVVLLIILWVPRRYAHTGYCVRTEDLHLRTGALFQSTTSVTLNRMQHLEINQGPLERTLGIARLMIFTAGGASYDLVLPGLPVNTAERLKEHLLQRIAPAATPEPEQQSDKPDPPAEPE